MLFLPWFFDYSIVSELIEIEIPGLYFINPNSKMNPKEKCNCTLYARYNYIRNPTSVTVYKEHSSN